METAKDWKIPPWQVTGENLTQWRRLVWKYRRELYVTEYNEKQKREFELAKFRNNGR